MTAGLPAELERLLRLDEYGALVLDLWARVTPELGDDIFRALRWVRSADDRVRPGWCVSERSIRLDDLRRALVLGEGEDGIDELRHRADDRADEATAESLRRLCDHVEATHPKARRRARDRARRAAVTAR